MSVALQDLKEGQLEIRAEIRELNRRIDRLLYAVVDVGAVALAGLLGVIANSVILIIRGGGGS